MNSLWRASLRRIQERFAGLVETPISCCLVQSVALRQTHLDPGEPYQLNAPARVGGWGRSGAYLEPTPLLTEDGMIVVGGKQITGPDGAPYLSPDGQPIAWDLGFRRDHSYFSDYPASFDSFERAARDAGEVLRTIPEGVRRNVWKNLPPRCRHADDRVGLWTDALFELAWQKISGVALRASEKATWLANQSFAIGILDQLRRQFPQLVPAEVTEEPEFWYSRIDNVAAASVAAIDVLLAIEDDGKPAESRLTQKALEMIKVLLLSANSIDSPLNIDEEFRAIDQKIRSSEHRDHVDLITHGAVRLEDVAGLLMRHKPQVVHFSGHGDVTGIELTGADGKNRVVQPDTLANIFRTLKDNIRVVLLNACDSASQAEAIVNEIDCAVGMSDEIDDNAAIAFAAAFYEALGYGRSVQTAFDLALVQLEGAGHDKSLAKLYRRPGVEPTSIILVNPPRPQ